MRPSICTLLAAGLFVAGLSLDTSAQVSVRAPVFKSKTAKNGTVRYTPLKGVAPFDLVVRLYRVDDDTLVALLNGEELPWSETIAVAAPDKAEPLGPTDVVTPMPGQHLILERLNGALELVIGADEPLPSGLNAEETYFTTQVMQLGKGKKKQDFEESPAHPLGQVAQPPGEGNVFAHPSIISGGRENSAEGELQTIGGGYRNVIELVQEDGEGPYGGRGHTIGGGAYNVASGYLYYEGYVYAAAGGDRAALGGYSTVGGGGGLNAYGEVVGNRATGVWSTVAGGMANTASGDWSTIGGGGSTNEYTDSGNIATGIGTTVSGGQANSATGSSSTVGGGKGNEATSSFTTIGGGSTNASTSLASTVGGGQFNTASDLWATIGGGRRNSATNDKSVVAGGEYNSATGDSSTVSGGDTNTASGRVSVVGGGVFNLAGHEGSVVVGGGGNTASGLYAAVVGGSEALASGSGSFLGGGSGNTASGQYTTVAGGSENTASGSWAVVAGGKLNTAAGDYSSVLGGNGNMALSSYSFAGGRQALAQHKGAFVWGDSSPGTKHSVEADSFNVYARGGSRFFTDANGTVGVGVAPGSGSWSTLSDRNMKDEVTPVDSADVLARVLELPIATWRYKTQDGVRHMGPMAQDFHAAFGLGVNEKLIDQVDPDGVALAAIQGLAAQKDEEIAALRAELAELRALVEALGQR